MLSYFYWFVSEISPDAILNDTRSNYPYPYPTISLMSVHRRQAGHSTMSLCGMSGWLGKAG